MSVEQNPYAPPSKVLGAGDADEDRVASSPGAPKSRDLSGLALLLGALAIERFVSSGLQTFLPDLHGYQNLSNLDASEASMGTLHAVSHWTALLGAIVGGVAALRLGPRATAAGGAVLAAVGHVALLFGAPALVGAAVVELGGNMMGPCFAAAAAETLFWEDDGAPRPNAHRVSAVTAAMVAFRVAIGVGSGPAPLVFGYLSVQVDYRLLHLIQGALMVLAAALAVTSARRRRRDAAGAAGARATKGIAGLAVLLVPYTAQTLGERVRTLRSDMVSTPEGRAVLVTGIIAGVGVSIVGFAVLVTAARRRWSLPPLLFYGAGLVVAAPGIALMANSTSASLDTVAFMLQGCGAIMGAAVTTAYAAVAVRGRAATLVVAGWTVVSMAAAAAREPLRDAVDWDQLLIWLCALLCAGGGIALLVYGRALHRKYFEASSPRARGPRRRARARG